MLPKSAKARYYRLVGLGLFIATLIIVGIPLFFLDGFANEDRDYALFGQVHVLAGELKRYKQEHGNYPETLSAIRSSENLCVHHFYTKCRKVHYKPSADLQDFRMALRAFSWPILFYHPQISMTVEESSNIPQAEKDALMEEYGVICFICMAVEQGQASLSSSSTPVYRETPPIFSNPEEWPAL